jgi:superfamily II DNA/RNA helicase
METSRRRAESVHAAMPHRRRAQILEHFREGDINVLSTTDTVAAEFDADQVALAVNFDVPEDSSDYVFRIGSIAGPGMECRAITLVEEKDGEQLERIENALGMSLEEIALPNAGEGSDLGDRPGRRERVGRREKSKRQKRPTGDERPCGKNGDDEHAGMIETASTDSLPAWMEISGNKQSKPSDGKDPVSNERLFHGGWKKLKKRR